MSRDDDAPSPSKQQPSPRAPHGPRGLLAALFHDAAPLDLRILGRMLMHAVVVGAAAGAMACAFFYALELSQEFFIDYLAGYDSLRAAGEDLQFGDIGARSPRPWLLVLLPAVGAFAASYLARRFAPECEGPGADATIRAFHQKISEVRRRVIWLKPIATVLTLATGGSGGREGPTMQVGGAIGSTLARYLRVSQRERRILLVSGMAAGTSAIFRTPLGAALLAIEMLYKDDFEADALVPAVLASVVGYSVFISVHGDATLFETAAAYPFVIAHLPLYGLMTVLLAGAGALFVRCLRQMETLANQWPAWARAATGGLGVGVLATAVAVFADERVAMGLVGGGYGAAQAAITGAPWIAAGMKGALVLALLGMAKLLASTLTIGTGGSAGAFGPTIVVGALLGGAFGQTAQTLLGDASIQPGAFALVGMGVLYGGIAHAPLGGLVIVCEMAGSYDLLVPLMLGSGIAFVVMRRSSLYKAQPRTKQDSPAHPPRVLQLLQNLKVEELMVSHRDFVVFEPGTPVSQVMTEVNRNNWQDVFPVVDADDTMRGMITPQLLRLLAAERDMEPWLVAADAMQPPVTIGPDDDLRVASERMLTHNLRELPVVGDDQRIHGFIDEADIGQVYLDHLR